jgi:hypothetical protein
MISFMPHLIVFEFLLIPFPVSQFTSPLTSVARLNQVPNLRSQAPHTRAPKIRRHINPPTSSPNLTPSPCAPPRSAPSISGLESPQCYQQQHSSAQRACCFLPSPAQSQSLLSAKALHSYNRARGPSQPFQFRTGVAHYGDRRYG